MKFVVLGSQLTSLVNFRAPLLRDLLAQGHEIVAVAPEPAQPWLGQLQAMGVRYIESPMARTGVNPLADVRLTFWLYKMFRAERPDVLLAFHAKPVIYGSIAAWLAGVRRRTAMIEGLGQGFADKAASFKHKIVLKVIPWLYRAGLQCAQVVFFLNQDDEAEFRQRRIINRQQVVRLPGIGIDLQHFSAQPLPIGPVTFLMMARLLAEKGVREFVAAAQLVKTRHPNARFLLLGPYDYSLSAITPAEIAAAPAVEYLGETSDVRPVLASCHVFVLPTFYREGLPRSILEAMATGRAILTTYAPGARETVVAGVNGFLVESRNPQALADAMEQMLLHPDKLEPMGKASRRLAEERYEVGAVNRLIIAALTDGI